MKTEKDALLGVYSGDGRCTGSAAYDPIHAGAMPHRTARVWLVHGNAAWFQRRPADDAVFPGRLDACASGHVLLDEAPVHAALMAFTDQTGMAIGPEDLALAGLLPMPFRRPDGAMDDETAWIYVYNPEALPAPKDGPDGNGFVPVSLYAYKDMLDGKEIDVPDASAFARPDPVEFAMVRRALERIWAGWRG